MVSRTARRSPCSRRTGRGRPCPSPRFAKNRRSGFAGTSSSAPRSGCALHRRADARRGCATGRRSPASSSTRSTIFSRRRISTPHGAGGGWPEYEVVRELAALVDQHVGDAIGDHPPPSGVAAYAWRRHQVGLGTQTLAAEPLAGATEAGDDLVGDEQDAVLVADALDLGPVGVRGDDHAAGSLHGLADEGGDAPRPDLLDPVGELARGAQPELGRRQLAAVLEPVRLVHARCRNRQPSLSCIGFMPPSDAP